MKAIALGMALSLTATGALAQARERFDLVCRGMTVSGPPNNLKTAVWDRRIRVDLVNGKFCYDTCPEIFAVAEVTEQAVYFSKNDVEGNYMLINRSTGHITGRMVLLGSFRHDTDADCVPEEYSGMADTRLF